MSFETLKERQSAMWGSGPFERIAETLADVHATTVESVAPESGEHVLDVAPTQRATARAEHEQAMERLKDGLSDPYLL
jgi:hypothetical protein